MSGFFDCYVRLGGYYFGYLQSVYLPYFQWFHLLDSKIHLDCFIVDFYLLDGYFDLPFLITSSYRVCNILKSNSQILI